MVYDREDLRNRPQLTFTHTELAHVVEAAKGNRDIAQKTLDKLKILWSYARTKDAYSQGATTITAR